MLMPWKRFCPLSHAQCSARRCVVLIVYRCAPLQTPRLLDPKKVGREIVTRSAGQNRCTDEMVTDKPLCENQTLTLANSSDSRRSSDKQSTLVTYLPSMRCFSSCDRMFLIVTLFELSVLPLLSNAPASFPTGDGASGSR